MSEAKDIQDYKEIFPNGTNEAVCNLADIAFDLIGIAPEEQDMEYQDIFRKES